ncbi:hypothetical protein G3565_34150, partial [Escherichia coli]|nr:hypothetical protein [Escherichia coli]
VCDGIRFDYEIGVVYMVWICVIDGVGVWFEKNFVIDVCNVNDILFMFSCLFNMVLVLVGEKIGVGIVVGSFVLSDLDKIMLML